MVLVSIKVFAMFNFGLIVTGKAYDVNRIRNIFVIQGQYIVRKLWFVTNYIGAT